MKKPITHLISFSGDTMGIDNAYCLYGKEDAIAVNKKRSGMSFFVFAVCFILLGNTAWALPPLTVTISSVSPQHGAPGSTVTITGSGFNSTASSNVVYFGGAKATVLSGGSTSLTVTVPARATYGPVSVENGGLTGYSDYPFLPNYNTSGYIAGVVGLDTPREYIAGNTPSSVVLGDLDGDGKLDMVITNVYSKYASIFLNTASSGTINSGSFAAPISLETDTLGFSAAISDVDGDGKPDLVISTDTAVYVYRNTSSAGSISFASPVILNSLGFSLTEVFVADFDGDGKPDIAVATQTFPAILVFQNTSSVGSISFVTPATYVVAIPIDGTYESNYNVAVADIDGDGFPDLITLPSSGFSTGAVGVILNTSTSGSISFGTASAISISGTGIALVVGDMDGDGKPDVAVGLRNEFGDSDNTVGVLRNTSTVGSVSFGSESDYRVGNGIWSMALASMSGGSRPDIVTSAYNDGNISILVNKSSSGSISFDTSVRFYGNENTTGLALGDIDGDGLPDVVAVNNPYSDPPYFYDSFNVEVFRNIPLSPISGVLSTCPSGSTTLSDLNANGTWSSSNVAVGTIEYYGGNAMVTGLALGTTTISYTLMSGGSTSVVVTVGAPSAGTIIGPSAVSVSSTITLTDATLGGFWSTSNSNASVSGLGTVTGESAGTVTISYTIGGSCGIVSATKIIIVGAADTSGIEGPSSICVGTTTTYTDISGSGGVWNSNLPSVASISSTGVVTGNVPGAATIKYTLSGVSKTRIITVNATPAVILGASGVCIGSTTLLTDPTAGGAWSSNGTGGSIDASGNISGISMGTTTVSYEATNGCTATRTINTNPLPSAIGGIETVCGVGLTTTLTDATPGSTGWSSNNTGVATVTNGGLVTGVSNGTVPITYTISGGCYITAIVTVGATASPINGNTPVCQGATITLTDNTGTGTWTSSTTPTATVGLTTGTVAGIAGGNATITYTAGSTGCKSTATVVVNPMAAISGATSICVGSSVSLADGTGGGTWSSSNTGIATVGTSTGVVVGGAGGNVNITYLIAATGCSQMVAVSVNSLSTAVSGPNSVCLGSTITLSDATTGGTWSSSNAVIATVGTGGIVTSSNVGTANISYTASGCKGVMTVSVNSIPATISGASKVCMGATTLLTDATTGGTWSNSAGAAGSVSASGTVTGTGVGNVTISYTLGSGCFGVHTVTTNALPSSISGAAMVCASGGVTTLSDGTTGAVSWTSDNTNYATVTYGGVVTGGSTTGTVTISYTVSSGCSITAIVTVNALPSAGTISGPTTVTTGSPITLTDGITGGIWTSQHTAIAIVGSTSGIVTAGYAAANDMISYTATGINGCMAYTTYTITSIVSAPHSGGSTDGGTTTIHVGDAVNITADAINGEWSSSNTTIATVDGSGIVTGIAAGIVSITHAGTNADGAMVTSETQVVVNSLPIDVAIIPNPNNGLFTVKGTLGSMNDGSATLEITDVVGHVIYKNKITANGGAINEAVQLSNNFADGVYMLHVMSGSESEVIRFVAGK